MKKQQKLSHFLEASLPLIKGEKTTLEEILHIFEECRLGFFLMLFALPMALPIPVPPGINIILATPLIILTAQMAFGSHHIWLPKSMRQRQFKSQTFRNIIGKSLPFLKKIEILIYPRLGFLTHSPFRNLIGICAFIMALTICIPLPMTNTVPSFGILLMSLGILMRDGLAVIAGAVIGLLWIGLLGWALYYFGAEGAEMIKEWIKSCC